MIIKTPKVVLTLNPELVFENLIRAEMPEKYTSAPKRHIFLALQPSSRSSNA